MASYSPIPEHPGTPGWQPGPPQPSEPISQGRQPDGWGPDFPPPPRSRRRRVWLPTVVTLVALVAVAAGVLPTDRLINSGRDGIGNYLPTGPQAELMPDRRDGQVWQTGQSVREAAVALAEFSRPVKESLAPAAAARQGNWLVVDGMRSDRGGGVTTLAYGLGDDTASLLAVESNAGWTTFTPGLPMLSPGLLTADPVTWEGRVARPETADGSAANATIRASVEAAPAGCRIVLAELSVSGSSSSFSTVWCSGEVRGWAGWSSDGPTGQRGFARSAAPPSTPPTTMSLETPDTPALTGKSVKRMRFFRPVGGPLYEFEILTSAQTARAGRTVVVADTEGSVTGWWPLDEAEPANSDYGMLWRARPGGSIRGLAAVGDLVVVGTTARKVTAITPAGVQLWQVEVPDAVTAVLAWGQRVLVADASGQLRLLDPRTGEEQWARTTGSLDRPPVVGGPDGQEEGTVAYLSENTLHVLDLATGAERWSSAAKLRSVEMAVAGDLVIVRDGSWLVARSRADGAYRWSRSVAAASLIVGRADLIMVFADSGAEAIGIDGGSLWSSPPAATARVTQDAVVLCFADRMEARLTDGSTRAWTYPDGYGPPDPVPVRAERGMVALQRDSSRTTWWEYA